MKKLILILMTILLMSTICSAQYDPPTGYTTYYKLRMWDEGDRPGADSVNQNLKDIDNILKNQVMHHSGFEYVPGEKRFTHKIQIGTPGSSLSTDSANKVYNRTFFMSEAPRCIWNPDNSASLTNKGYVDNEITTAGTGYVHLSGTEVISGAKTFSNATTIFGDDVHGSSYINIVATDNAAIQFNGATFINWNASVLTVSGEVDATGYKLNGGTAYLTSAFGTPTAQSLWVSSTSGGTTTTQLNTVDLTINGTKYKVLIAE